MSDWAEVGSPPDGTSGLLTEAVLEDAGIPALIRHRGVGSEDPFMVEGDFLSVGPRDVLVPEPNFGEVRDLLEDTTSLHSWTP
ncbi:MAG: hypothetical protein AVDCRST_MAG80-2619 [uncultured Rubrobacteraceae bacterium]|uniref:DUF2007 domain-containing protein n=1 Tax=uncultured Rubrobacteraceae bacterium TaxID=349277 RepID=A0A6J4QUK7_9ACTN|nr:MAG: hypothetical protein AVDCRST_MAG80-2619 [uncultured Rubrobacteraceae bacterium]